MVPAQQERGWGWCVCGGVLWRPRDLSGRASSTSKPCWTVSSPGLLNPLISPFHSLSPSGLPAPAPGGPLAKGFAPVVPSPRRYTVLSVAPGGLRSGRLPLQPRVQLEERGLQRGDFSLWLRPCCAPTLASTRLPCASRTSPSPAVSVYVWARPRVGVAGRGERGWEVPPPFRAVPEAGRAAAEAAP